MKQRYSFSFDPIALILFLVVMLPTMFWSFFPTPDDVLREVSRTPLVDTIGSVFQVAMIALLIFLKREGVEIPRPSQWTLCCIAFVFLYFLSWLFYYCGNTPAIVLLGMTLPPCLAFASYALGRKNHLALLPTLGFSICHLIYCIVNFIL